MTTDEITVAEEPKEQATELPNSTESLRATEGREDGRRIRWNLLLLAVLYLGLDYYLRTLPVSYGIRYPVGAMLGSGLSVLLFLYALYDQAGLRQDVGLTFKQRPKSLPFSLTAVALMLVIGTTLRSVGSSAIDGWWNVLQSSLIAPVTEELAYRGVAFALLCRAFGSQSRMWPVLVSALCFGFPHAFVYVAGKAAFATESFSFIVVMGLILGAIRARSGSLLFPLLFHVAWNGSRVLASVLQSIL